MSLPALLPGTKGNFRFGRVRGRLRLHSGPLPDSRRLSNGQRFREAEAAQNYIGRLLADHVHRAHDEKSRNAREHRGIHNAQSTYPIDAKLAVEHSILLPRTDSATARRMVSPGVIANVLSQIFIRLKRGARHLFLSDHTIFPQLRRNSTNESDTVHDGVEILATVLRALLKIAEVYPGRIARIFAKRDLTSLFVCPSAPPM